jgi:hypothetical protein
VKLARAAAAVRQLSKAAAPVRDGLLTGYYGEARRRPEVIFYDTAGTRPAPSPLTQKASAKAPTSSSARSAATK